MTNKFEACTNAVKESGNQELLDFVGSPSLRNRCRVRNVSLADSGCDNSSRNVCQSALVYVNYAESEIEKHFNFIRKFKAEELESYIGSNLFIFP